MWSFTLPWRIREALGRWQHAAQITNKLICFWATLLWSWLHCELKLDATACDISWLGPPGCGWLLRLIKLDNRWCYKCHADTTELLQLEALNQLVTDGLASGEVLPLPVTVFNRGEIEEAFRYLASGHPLKLCDFVPPVFACSCEVRAAQAKVCTTFLVICHGDWPAQTTTDLAQYLPVLRVTLKCQIVLSDGI